MSSLRTGTKARRCARRRLVTLGIAAAARRRHQRRGQRRRRARRARRRTSDVAAHSDPPATASGEPLLVYGVFATPIEEPWDGVIHAALKRRDDGEITYKHVDNIDYRTGWSAACATSREREARSSSVTPSATRPQSERSRRTSRHGLRVRLGGKEQAPNLAVFDNWMQDPAYLAGMLAGGMTKSTSSAWSAAMPIPEVNRIVNAFIAGVARPTPRSP